MAKFSKLYRRKPFAIRAYACVRACVWFVCACLFIHSKQLDVVSVFEFREGESKKSESESESESENGEFEWDSAKRWV